MSPTGGSRTGTAEARLWLWQLLSPALPIGAYAYSRGLEYAVGAGWVRDEAAALQWIGGQLRHSVSGLEVPVLARLYRAYAAGDPEGVEYWNGWLLAARESAELRAEDRCLGAALARLLCDLGIEGAGPPTRPSFAAAFALATQRFGIALEEAALAYAFVWCEQLVAAAVKLIPLGQTAGQRLLLGLGAMIPDVVRGGLALEDEDIGANAPGLGIASALHETQYTRLFRS
jgi:urease accessory protein